MKHTPFRTGGSLWLLRASTFFQVEVPYMVLWCDRSTLTLRARVLIPLSPGTFVLQQDTLSTLLLSTQVLNGDPVGCVPYCGWVGIVHTCKMATGQNAPHGVEKVHSECRIDSESYDQGNNTLWSALILIGKALYIKTSYYYANVWDTISLVLNQVISV